MDLAELEVLVCLIQEQSFSRAAEKLHRSQPTISQTLKRLEEEVGDSLFDRSARNGGPTSSGRLLLGYAKRMLQLRAEALSSLQEMKVKQRGHLRLVATECIALYLLPAFLRRYRKTYPGIKLEVIRSMPNRVKDQVLDQEVDFGFITFDPIHPELSTHLLERDELVLVAPPSHPLSRREGVSIPDLGREPFISFSAQTPAKQRLVELFALQRTPLNIAVELSSLETIKEFVRQGDGLAFLPRMAVRQEIEAGFLREIPVKGVRIPLQIRMLWRKNKGLATAAQAFLELARSMGKEAVI